MRYVLVQTTNVQKFMDAASALEARLTDGEILGMGLIYGRPGLGKTMAMDAYHARNRKTGRIRTVKVRALAIWTEASMLKDLLRALGQSPRQYRKDVMFDQLVDALKHEPGLFLMDEIDAIAESRRLISLLKDVHDITGSCILMIGEERVNGLLRRYEAFYNRMNRRALVHLSDHTEEDVQTVIEQRCEVVVEPDVCSKIHRAVGKSMRSVIDTIRDMEAFARTNNVERIGRREYHKVSGLKTAMRPMPVVSQGSAAVGGARA